MKTREAAKGKWVGILTSFGIDESYLRNKHGPCPICKGKDRFRFDDKDGRGTYFCSHCGPGDGVKLFLACTGYDFKVGMSKIDQIVGNIQAGQPKPKVDPSVRLRKIGQRLLPMDDVNPARLYLKNRGLKASNYLKYSRSLGYYEDGKQTNMPAMVALFQSPEGEALTYHITYLTDQGEKATVNAPRKMMTPVRDMAGGAIRLSEIKPHIAVAEGIETALAVTMMYQVPCWATATAGLMEKFIPPKGVEKISIYGDSDRSYTGQKAAYTLAHRLANDYDCNVFIPEGLGLDFADKLSITRPRG